MKEHRFFLSILNYTFMVEYCQHLKTDMQTSQKKTPTRITTVVAGKTNYNDRNTVKKNFEKNDDYMLQSFHGYTIYEF